MTDHRKGPNAVDPTHTTMSALLRLMHRCWRAFTRLTDRLARVATQLASTGIARTVTFVVSARERITSRWHSDTTYRRTLVAALAAIAATVLPHPFAAAAIGALVAEPALRTNSSRRPSYLEDYDEDDDYPPRRPPVDPWAPSPRRLWDALE